MSLVFYFRIGGLGHLAIQYAAKFGYTVVVVSRGTAKKDHALQLGVRRFKFKKGRVEGEGDKTTNYVLELFCFMINLDGVFIFSGVDLAES